MPNDVGLYAYAEDPHDSPRHALELLGGANIQVATGRQTTFERFSNDGNVVVGSVVTVDQRQGVPTGMVVVTAALDPARGEEHLSVVAPVQEGSFFARLPSDQWKVARADYLGEVGYGPCSHDWIERR